MLWNTQVDDGGGGSLPSSTVAQYDATVTSSLLSGGSQVSDGGGIDEWEDQIDGFNVTGGSPTREDNIKNSNTVVRWDGTDDVLDESSLSESQPFTVLTAAKFTDTEFNKVLFANRGTSGDRLFFATDTDTNNNYRIFTDTGEISAGTRDTNWHIFGIIFDGASSKFRIDGTEVASGDLGSTGFDSAPGLKFGIREGGSGQYFDGDIGELVVYNDNLESSGDLSSEETRLSDKWGITI